MPLFELTLTQFLFPEDLPNKKANFRFVVDLRFIDDKGRFTTEHSVMPSLDTFWECSRKNEDAPNYVRQQQDIAIDGTEYGQFNMEAIDDWDKLILHVKGSKLHSIQFKVLDVNREDAWDKVKPFLKGIVEAVIGKIKGVIPGNLPLSLPESLGGAADDVQSFLLKKLAGGNDVLFRGSCKFEDLEDLITDGDPKEFKVEGHGTGNDTKGDYQIGFSLCKRSK